MVGLEQKNKTIKALIKKVPDNLSRDEAEDLKAFIEAFYTPSTPDDIAETDPSDLFAFAHAMWKLSQKRKKGEPIVRVFCPSLERDGWADQAIAIQIINDDMPFLVDSITGGLTIRHRCDILRLHHPIMRIERGQTGKRMRTVGPVSYTEKDEGNGQRESYIFLSVQPPAGTIDLAVIQADIEATLKDVRVAVEDWRPMLKMVRTTAQELLEKKDAGAEDTAGFLEWLTQDHFTFLGYREYRFDGDPRNADFKAVRNSGLGLLRDPGYYILRGPKGLTSISSEIREFLTLPDPVIITKANIKTRVHRPVHMDYIGIKMFDKAGKVIGEKRFVGLFTSQSYSRRAQDIPMVRNKVRNVQRRSQFSPGSHAYKRLTHILETFPRDELFQIHEDQLLEVSLGVIHLMGRPRPRAFVRRDKFERFVSALVYVPREKYNSILRVAIEKILCDAFHGELSVYYAQLSEDVLARWHFIIRTKPGDVPNVDMAEINRRIQETATDWEELFARNLLRREDNAKARDLVSKYKGAFSIAYKEAFHPYQAGLDVLELEKLQGSRQLIFALYQNRGEGDNGVHLKIYGKNGLVPLTQCMPLLENLGFNVIGEHAYLLNDDKRCVHDFSLESRYSKNFDPVAMEDQVEALLDAVCAGNIENDGFNALTAHTGLDGWETVIIRAYAKYLRQLGLNLSQDYIEDCMIENARITQQLVTLFEVRFKPKLHSKTERQERCQQLVKDIRAALNRVKSLDQDRILRGYLVAIMATVRTNFYQRAFRGQNLQDGVRPGLAFKINTRKIDWAPRPRPYREIFVYSPRYEGVHLRGGPVARGGLRWSDRREDFRTEILGLVKAQQVKNAVIVPVGAKGGFVPKYLPEDGDREAILAEGIACYKSFIVSLLSVTDNLEEKKARPPKNVVRWDEGDPYLVVAADKGTATFSDTANDLATSRHFWLGDAFASGGSNGYDHKKMGITAKGAWVSVARHFREMGLNVAKDPFTVIGIGDMSGDVFGNGMLLSKAIRLQAAFDHRHIFFDPDPDPGKSWEERKRLFDQPRSSWDDYDRQKISKGGGVFSRSDKAIKLSPQFREFLGVEVKELSPTEVIHHILMAKADLLWVGGIGTYVKASDESHSEVGDRANDAIRVNGSQLNVRVVGEGGNLGLTQRGRIEFARAGGRLNTDFIDNSAGVDCSDKEVNIKILLSDAIQCGDLKEKDRVPLLAAMTDDVSKIVLEDNYLQTQAISLAERVAVRDRDVHASLIRLLERDAGLARDIEFLPNEEGFAEMESRGTGLTRPEISVVLAYAKMSLTDILSQAKVLDDPVMRPELEWGFPKTLREKFPKSLSNHQLRREIVATTLANQVINRGGLTLVYEVKEETGLSVEQIVSAFILVRDAFRINKVWSAIDKLDYKIPADIQMDMLNEVADFIRNQTTWFLRNVPRPIRIQDMLDKYREGLDALLREPEQFLSELTLEQFKVRWGELRSYKIPNALAHRVAALAALGNSCDIVDVAAKLNRSVEDVARAYFKAGHLIGFDWLMQVVSQMTAEDRWSHLALNSLQDEISEQHRELTRSILATHKKLEAVAAVDKWDQDNQVTVLRADRLISDLRSSGQINVAKLSFAARHMRSILPV